MPMLRLVYGLFWLPRLAWKRMYECILTWLMIVAIVSLSEGLYQVRTSPEELGEDLITRVGHGLKRIWYWCDDWVVLVAWYDAEAG